MVLYRIVHNAVDWARRQQPSKIVMFQYEREIGP